MSIVIIEFYDCGVRISDGKSILANSVTCALIESDKSIHVGEQAESQAHLRPRECSRFFWSRLSENSATKYSISNAEIALHHLKYLWNLASYVDHDAVLITPVTLDKRDLGLLLGICKKLSINVAGIIANATLAMQGPVKNCKAVYLDLLQQQLAFTEIIQSDAGVSLKQPSRTLNYGLQQFIKNNAKSIAKKFISETRFDPLYSANDEQQFFDKLPLWLTMLNDNHSIECKLSSNHKHYIITIENDQLQKENKQLYEELATYLNVLFHNHNNIAIYCSSSCKQVFGLHKFLASLPGCAAIQLDEVSLTAQAIKHEDNIIFGEQVHYINTLPWNENKITTHLDFSPGKLSNLSRIPSHILINGHAHSLQQGVFIANNGANSDVSITFKKSPDSLCRVVANKLSVEVQTFNKQPIYLNQNELETVTTASIGDKLNINDLDTDYLFIKVVSNET